MFKEAAKFIVVVSIGIGVSYPVSQELAKRAAIQRTMINSLNENDMVALKEWPGSATSFIEMLHDRCMRAHAGDADACTHYQVAD
jgi:hypothetical protein